jgi:hypothetical protein
LSLFVVVVVVIIWSSDPLHVDWLGFSQLATGLNQQSSDTFFLFLIRDTSSAKMVKDSGILFLSIV